MKGYKQVSKKEFKRFIERYPRMLKTHFIFEWLDYYDFPKDFNSTDLEEVYSHIVAREYHGRNEIEYYIKTRNNIFYKFFSLIRRKNGR